MRFPMKTLALTFGLLAKMNTFANAENFNIPAIKKEIGELKSSEEWPKGASASTIAYLTSIGQWPVKTSEGKNTVASAGTPPANDTFPPANDSCASATEITSLPFYSSGDTTDASSETGVALSDCGTISYDNAPAVWYKVTGTGGSMSAETIAFYSSDDYYYGNDDGSFDTKLHIYSGSCGAFTCVGGNDDTNGLLSRVEWDSVPCEEYYILVFGFGSNPRAYNLEVTSDGPNAVCSSARPSMVPSDLIPSDVPSFQPSSVPSDVPSDIPSDVPSDQPSSVASDVPSDIPSDVPSDQPSSVPSDVPSDIPSDVPSDQPSSVPSDVPSDSPSSFPSFIPSSEPSWVDDEQCQKRDPENDVCAELDGRCKLDCEDDEDFVCVPGLCSYDRNWDKPTKSPKMRQLKVDEEGEVVDFEITAEGGVERKLKATKAPSEKGTKATKAPKSSCACRVPRARGCKK